MTMLNTTETSSSSSSSSTVSAASTFKTKETYDLTCYGSRIGSVFPSNDPSQSSSWTGPLLPSQPKGLFQCAPLGFGLIPIPASVESLDATTTMPILQSEHSIQRMQQQWLASGTEAIAVELWMTMSKTQTIPYAGLAPIFTIGQSYQPPSSKDKTQTPAPHTEFGSRGCKGHDFQIAQASASSLRFSFTDDDSNRSCRGLTVNLPQSALVVSDDPADNLMHVLVALEPKILRVYINGHDIFGPIPTKFLATIQNWYSDYHMQLFDSGYGVRNRGSPASPLDIPLHHFEGSIHQLSIHNRALDPAQARTSYILGLQEVENAAKTKTAPPVPNDNDALNNGGSSNNNNSHGNGNDSTSTNPPQVPPGDYNNPGKPQPPAIEGLPTLLATPNATFSIPQGHATLSTIVLKGLSSISPMDSDNWWSLKAEIISTTKYGSLTRMDDNNATHPIQVGDLLDLELLQSDVEEDNAYGNFPPLATSVQYKLESTSYFNVPRHSITGDDLGVEPETFGYRLLAIDNLSNDVLATSTVVRQPVHVLYVNRPSTLVTTVSPTSSEEEQGFVWGENVLLSQKTFPRAYLVDTISFQKDPSDLNIDRVRVDVRAENGGTLSLNDEHLHLAQFNSCRNRDYSPWQCVGDGKDDKRMTFMAYPNDLELILAKMEYVGRYRMSDTIMIRVWDGEGGDCLTHREHSNYIDDRGRLISSIYNGQCYGSAVEFQLNGKEGQTFSNMNDEQQFYGKYFYLFLLFVVLSCCCGFYGMFQRCKARGERVASPEKKAGKDSDKETNSDASDMV